MQHLIALAAAALGLAFLIGGSPVTAQPPAIDGVLRARGRAAYRPRCRGHRRRPARRHL